MVIDGGNGPSRKGGKAPARRGPRVEEPHTLIRLPEDPYAGGVPRRGGRGRGVLALAVLVVVVAAVITLANGTHRKSDQSAIAGVGGGVPGQNSSTASSAPTAQGSNLQDSSSQPNSTQQFASTQFPGLLQGGVLVGYSHTKNGAEAAAANFVSAYGSEDMLHPDSRRKVVQAIADPAIQSTLQSQLDQAFATVNENLGLDKYGNAPKGFTVVSRSFALGVQVNSYTNSDASVSVWTNSLLGTAGSAQSAHPVVEVWSTITLELTWVKGDWKWHSFSVTDGPTPVSSQAASTSDAIQKAAQQFARLRYAP